MTYLYVFSRKYQFIIHTVFISVFCNNSLHSSESTVLWRGSSGIFLTSCYLSLQVINIEESLAVLTRCSFDESHRQPIFLLGGIPALAEIIQVEEEPVSPIFLRGGIPALAEIIQVEEEPVELVPSNIQSHEIWLNIMWEKRDNYH